jgi:outer membrane biogenesis lipoprotein LolB
MKTHMLLALFTVFVMSACASREGRQVSSTEQQAQEEYQTRMFPQDRFTR